MPTASAASWVRFFANAGIPSQAAAGYAHVFVENRIQMDMLMDLNKEYLREMGITTMGDIIAILRHSKIVSDQSARDKVLSTPGDVEHGSNNGNPVVPVAAVSATQSSTPKSVISRPNSTVSLPSKQRRVFPEHKITLPAGTGKSNNSDIRIITDTSDRKSSLTSTVGSLGNKKGVFKRLSHNSDDDVGKDDDQPPAKIASIVAQKDSEMVGGSIFSRLGGKSKRDSSDAPAGILKNSSSKIVPTERQIPTGPQKVILVKKIPAKAITVSDEEDMHRSSRQRDFDRMDTSDNQKSVSFSEEDEVLEFAPRPPRPKTASMAGPRSRFHERDIPVRARLGQSPNRKQQISPLRGPKNTVFMKASTAGNVTTLSPSSLARSKMKSDAMLIRKTTPIKNRLSLGSSTSPPGRRMTQRAERFSLDSKMASMKLRGPGKPIHRFKSPQKHGASTATSVFDRLGYNRK
ncbi:uncharacterized protein C19orf47 [Toxorhynchites rutilus septentrionalis]|uniref:uncharacterized protein C19orf47 n=1 Tax=Toxorhynchites rutilus septentrionalis TaxID=329112 RepID=UPI0024799457|nr:uncharacterized protein C19orf47 [Toxorhynchites rutilus septentrionalis]